MSEKPKTETSEKNLSLPLVWRLLLAVIAGLLLSAGYALHPLWWAPWLVPVALIPALPGKPFGIGALAGALATLSVLGYYLGQSGAWIGTLMILILRILSWSFAARMTEIALRKGPALIAVLILPALTAGLETLILTLSIHGAAGSLAYSQMAVLPVLQLAAAGGVPLIVFVVVLPGALLGVWLTKRRREDLKMAAAATALVLLVAGLFAGMRLTDKTATRQVPVALVVTDRFENIPSDWQTVWQTYRPAVMSAAPAGGVTVLPEKIALLQAAQIGPALDDVRAVAKATQTTLVLGLETHVQGVYRNRALVVTPDGVAHWYDKQRLVPGFEARDVPGHTPLLVTAAGTRMGIAVCKDMHIPSIGREYAGRAAFMAVPAWDFGQDGWMGARMTMMRGIENGYAIARSARNGMAGVYDAYGRPVAEAVSSSGLTVVKAAVPAGQIATLYTQIGDLFGWLCCVFTGGVIVAGMLKRRSDQIRPAL